MFYKTATASKVKSVFSLLMIMYMNLFKIVFVLLVLFYSTGIQAQDFTISGNLKDATNGEDLIYANVLVEELPGTGTTTNSYGFYSITLPQGEYNLRFQYIGYEPLILPVSLTENQTLNVDLGEAASALKEVVIKGEKDNVNVTRTEMSITKVTPKQIEAVPVLLGEKDIVKTLTLTPGISQAGEGTNGFYVRGGGIDQNLILLDESTVYNASHLLGFFSVFNSDAIKDVTLYKGGMPAQYGGRASSVMDIIMKDGNNKRFGATGGIGLISSRLTLEGPIQKDKSSFIISGRRTYADIFLGFSNDETVKNSKLFFYDLNMKANYRLNDKNRIFLSGYFGRDKFSFGDQLGFNWGNATGTLRWNHLFTEKLFGNTSLIFSDYDYSFDVGQGDDSFGLDASITDWNLKQDFSWYANTNNTLKFGLQAIHHKFEPGTFDTGTGSDFNSIILPDKFALEGGAYVQNDQKIGARLGIQYGLRYSLFNYIGPGDVVDYNDAGEAVGEPKTYGDWESVQVYHGLEPRLSLNFSLTEISSLKAAYNRNFQYIHLLSNTVASSPTDTWIPSSNNVKPQIANQVSLGYFQNLADNMYEFSSEIYFKTLENQIDYRNGANLFLNEEIESELIYGDGTTYGIELFLQKRKGDFSGWIGYTLARSIRNFDDVNDGETYSARQDRIHDASIVGIYKLNDRLTFSANWVYYTGDAVTFPVGTYQIDGQSGVPQYSTRNGSRFPAYHRMDIGATLKNKNKKSKRFESDWNFSIYNVYGRENAFTITFRPNEDDPTINEAERLAVFKWIPSVTYNFKY